ncbi:alpha/beta hydrolase [Frankia sp. AgB32]|uniref:alpha/beta fold hydrolase n=1 Tax=Frankia sp. AgB32 TaxID=631119 RepID=UPI002010941E|nr:alpha/beta hydrolase [Frankia sp. AgB32]MCK9897292.1 alpha/beta hydrolase [Frankia sp. AgB32]
MIETRQWQLTVASGLDLHVEEIRPDGAPAGTARLAAELSWDPAPPRPVSGTGQPSEGLSDSGDDGTMVPVVLVHGIAGSAADWAAVAPNLATNRRVIAYDQRGHGASGPAPGGRPDYTFDLLLADLGVVVDSLDAKRIDLVGHSMGGVISLRYALDHPDRVRSLVLVDTAAAPATATGPLARRVVGALLDRVAAFTSAHRRATGPAGGESRAAGGGGPGGIEAVRHDASPAQRQVTALSQMDPEAVAALGRELGRYPSLVPRLGEITAPTTVLVGENDTSLRDSARTMTDAIPNAHLAVIAGADHSPHASRPLAWLTALDNHFARLTAAR